MKRVSSQIARFLLPAIYVERLDAQVAFEAFFFFAACSLCPSRFLFCNTHQSLLCPPLSSKVTLGSSVRL